MQSWKEIVRETAPILFLTTLGGIVAGLLLEGIRMDLEYIPGLLILLPAIIGMRGNISGALGSRLASALHLGLLKPEFEKNDVTVTNFMASIVLNIGMSFLLGIMAHFVGILFGLKTAGVLVLTFISVVAGTLAGFMLTILTFYFAVMVYRRGLDPDNVLAPTLATVGDALTVVCLLIAVKAVLYLGLI